MVSAVVDILLANALVKERSVPGFVLVGGADGFDVGRGTIKVLAERQLGLTVCPISNAFVTDGPQTDVIKRMLDLGLRVTVNSDDPAYFGGYIGRNYLEAANALGLDRKDLAQLARNSLLASFVTDAERAGWLRRLEELAQEAVQAGISCSEPSTGLKPAKTEGPDQDRVR